MSSFSEAGWLERLEQLEKESERLTSMLDRSRREVNLLKWFLVGSLVLAAAGLVALRELGVLKLEGMTGGISTTVESKEFGLFNREGNRVLLADLDKFGYPNLIFMDVKKNYRMGVKVWPEGGGTPGLVFYDGTGVRGNLRMGESGSSVLHLTGANQKGSISLSVTPEGDPSLIITDRSGAVLLEVPKGASQARPSEPAGSEATRGPAEKRGR